jgi:tetratricopeptide (TPR) repeat protein
MGGKRAGRGKRFLLHLACAGIVLRLAGCAGLPEDWPGAANPLAEAREQWAEGRFDEALAQADEVLETRTIRFGEDALFLKGLLYADTSNPDADLDSAREAFEGVVRRFPESRLRKEADLWAATIRETLKARERAAAASKRARLLGSRLEEEEKVSRSRENQVKRLRERIHRLRERIRDLETRMEQMKRVDMELEEQKQKTLR